MDPAALDLMLKGLPKIHDPNLLLGYSQHDDCAVYRLPSGEQIVQTVDFFTPVVDDPFDFGAIAAANSLSDVYAMNARPLFALNICCFPKSQSAEVWHEVLRGGADKAKEAGIGIAGGHTVDDEEPKYGLVVTGLVEAGRYWANAGAKVGDELVLTKAIGTGLITTLLKSGEISLSDARETIQQMKQLNRSAAEVLSRYDVHSCTDITGFGLLGHAWEMAEASGVGLELSLSKIPKITAAKELAKTGKFPGGTRANRSYLSSHISIPGSLDESLLWLCFDAQTSGGLLASIPSDQVDSVVRELRAAGLPNTSNIGRVTAGTIITIVD